MGAGAAAMTEQPMADAIVAARSAGCALRARTLAITLVVLLPTWAAAGPPGGGSILQQIQPVTPPAPSATHEGVTIESKQGASAPPTAPFLVVRLEIRGNTQFDTATLHALIADGEGKNLTLAELDELAARVTGYYHGHGYPLARAILPEQTIHSGVVVIEVIEARYGAIRLDNRSRVSDSLLSATLGSLSGEPIEQATLDRRLLLLADVPGVTTGATLAPGATTATSDLIVEVAPGPRFIGDVSIDDYGSIYNGRFRAGGNGHFLNPLGHGDDLSLSLLTSGHDMNYGRAAYDALLFGSGLHGGASYSKLDYILGGTLEHLDGYGTAEIASAWLKQPVWRTVPFNLYAQLRYDKKVLHDELDGESVHTERHLGNTVLSLTGDERDAALAGGLSLFSAEATSGHVGFDNEAALAQDAKTAKTEGGFVKVTANVARLQSLDPTTSLYVNVIGQWASTNLDEAEKLAVGGEYTVRAYDMGAISADLGLLATGELRRDLGATPLGAAQLVGFADWAHVTVNKNTWTGGANSATLGGGGIGLNFVWPNRWSAKAELAARVGATPTLIAATSSVRAWVEVSKAF